MVSNFKCNHQSADKYDNVEGYPTMFDRKLGGKRKLNNIFELIGDQFQRRLIIHVYQGANEAGHQWYPFHRATKVLNMDKVAIIYCNIKMVKDNNWSPKELVDWLLDCDVHFIITHIHQGLEDMHWRMNELYEEVQRLHKHAGYPNGQHLRCPIWTQDKYDYLVALSAENKCNPTVRIELVENMDYCKIKEKVVSELHNHLEGMGYVLKTPFTTNRANFRKARDADQVISKWIMYV